MPALWQASQRPMFVRTVWVDGFRHAILTQDDPYYNKLKKRRPYSSASTAYSGYSNKISRHKREDSGRLSLVITNKKSNFLNRQIEPEIEKLNLNDIDQESEESFAVQATPQPICEYDSNRSNFENLDLNMRAFKSNRTARSEKANTDFSDRVLQWLDLAGKIDLLAPDNAERMTQPRHSWPGTQKQNLSKSKTIVDFKVKEDVKTPNDSARTQTSVDRRDYHVPPSAGTIESYARQSRNKMATRDTGRKTTKRDIRVNVLEARQKVMQERNAVEKQYAELVSKKLIPDLGKGKKQVHIFLPETIKKNSMTSRAESLLSQIS